MVLSLIMKRTYELTLVLRTDFPVDDTKKRDELLAKLTKGAAISNCTVLGKKKLAYTIKKKVSAGGRQEYGIFLQITLEAESMRSSDIEKEVKLGTEVLRYLLIVKEEGGK